MRKNFFKSVLLLSLSAALILGCPAMGSTVFASSDDVMQATDSETIEIEEEVSVDVTEEVSVEYAEEVTEEITAEVQEEDATVEIAETDIQPLTADSDIAVYASTGVTINATNFPDKNFRQYILDNIDTDKDGVLSGIEIEECTYIKCTSMGIADLTGIELFYNLRQLYCYSNNLSELDVSNKTQLLRLECDDNNLNRLDVSGCTALQRIDCSHNNLETLDVNSCSCLLELNCSYNNFITLDISEGYTIYCSHNELLESLDVSNNTRLRELYCYSNKLSSLDVSKNTNLEMLGCSDNNLSKLDVSKNTALEYLYCGDNNLSKLDVSKNTVLIHLECGGNNLSKLDVSKNTELISLRCDNNKLSSIDVSENLTLCYLYCWGNKFSTVDTTKSKPTLYHTQVILLNTPVINTPTKVSSGIEVSWSESIGAEGYYVYRRETGGSWKRIAKTERSTLSFTDKTASSGKTYEYTVRGYWESQTIGIVFSGYNKNGKSITLVASNLATPKISKINNVDGGVKITWGKVTGAEKYRIYYKTGSGSWTKLADTTATSYTWKNAKSGTKYTFTVRCVSSDGKTATSSYDKTGTSKTYIAAPQISSVSNVNGGVKITWGKVTGAVKYRVYYKTGSSGWKKITDTTSTSYTWKNAKSGTKYTFTVRCVSSDGKTPKSGYSSTGKSKTYIAAPQISKINNTTSGVKITWGKVTGAAKYRVYYKTGSGSWKKLADTTSTSYTWKNAKSGTKYYFTVRCVSSDGKTATSSYDSTGKSKTYIAAPQISSVSKVSNGVKISWGKVTGAAKYRVYYKTGNGSWKKLTDTTSTSYTWNGGKKGTTYTFTVRCINSTGTSFTSGVDTTGKKITY